MRERLTVEQAGVVHHPHGQHARVLAVAGAGKTTTMVYRVKHLVETVGVSPNAIGILMFNTRARFQFREKLNEVLPLVRQPNVHNFHSYSYSLIREAQARGFLSEMANLWIGDKEELVRINVHKAIAALERRKEIPPDGVDPDKALECIGLWKGSLITPDRAGHRSDPVIPLVYQEFENIRLQNNAITFDDFVPIAVGILTEEPSISRNVINSFDAVIVDEYQDVNHGQQRLIELIAGTRADVMVVGDDDQTIYEWRGARSEYIVREFRNVFSNKSVVDYTLSRTFRFGPVIAQAAQNVISLNTGRVAKRIIAHEIDKDANILVFRDTSKQPTDVNKELATQVLSLVRQTRDPQKIIVLSRMYSQMNSLEAEFLSMGIPYRVVGRDPFFKRREITVLLDYLRLALALDQPLSKRALELQLSVANVPNRMISKDAISRTASSEGQTGQTTRRFLHHLSNAEVSPLTSRQRNEMQDLADTLDRLAELINSHPSLTASQLLTWLVERVDFFSHYENYYGKGESSEDRKRSIKTFIKYASDLGLHPVQFLDHVEQLDSTKGVPEDQQIVMTTMFRVKGEEFDYVIVPNCDEGYMPCLFGNENEVYDRRGLVSEPPTSDIVSNERRLFYVAITRARKTVLIGTSDSMQSSSLSSSGASSQFIEEMLLEPTVEIFGAFRRLAAGDSAALAQLEKAAMRHAGRKLIINNLIEEYLKVKSLKLSATTMRALLSAPEIPYHVRKPLAQVGISSDFSSSGTPRNVQKPAWWDDPSDTLKEPEWPKKTYDRTMIPPDFVTGDSFSDIDIEFQNRAHEDDDPRNGDNPDWDPDWGDDPADTLKEPEWPKKSYDRTMIPPDFVTGDSFSDIDIELQNRAHEDDGPRNGNNPDWGDDWVWPPKQ